MTMLDALYICGLDAGERHGDMCWCAPMIARDTGLHSEDGPGPGHHCTLYCRPGHKGLDTNNNL